MRPASSSDPHSALRASLRAARDALPAARRQRWSRRISRLAAGLPLLRRGARIGLYAGIGSEADVDGLRALARQRGARIYLPRIRDYQARRMQFCRVRATTRLRINRYGIGEPADGEPVQPRDLDLLLLPLLAFDSHGNRLGYGGGYYDRWLARAGAHRRPLRIGIAFACQELPRLDRQPHDVRLHGVLTERGLRMFIRT